MTLCQDLSDILTKRPSSMIPALLTRISTLPRPSSTSLIIRVTWSTSDTSACMRNRPNPPSVALPENVQLLRRARPRSQYETAYNPPSGGRAPSHLAKGKPARPAPVARHGSLNKWGLAGAI